jgi:hypothetical protein
MDLYDHLVSLYKKELVILTRAGNGVKIGRCNYHDIVCLEYREDLLNGRLRITAKHGELDLSFNTVSGEVMCTLVELIRQRYIDGTQRFELERDIDIPEGELSFYFAGLLRQMKRRNPELRVLARQPETPIGPHETRPLRTLFFNVTGKRLLESMHLSDGAELQIVTRGRTFRYRGQTVYAIDTHYFPVHKIDALVWLPNENTPGITTLTIHVGGHRFSFAFIKKNPSIPYYAGIV